VPFDSLRSLRTGGCGQVRLRAPSAVRAPSAGAVRLPFRRDDGIVVVEVGRDDAMEPPSPRLRRPRLEDVSPALQARLGPDATTGLLALLETAREEWKDDVTAAAVERFERRLTEEMSGVRAAMAHSEAGLRGEMHQLEMRLRGEMREGETRLCEEMGKTEARLREEMRDLAAALREEGRVNTATLREEMRSGTSGLRIELKDEMSKLRVDGADTLRQARVDMMRWSFSLWVGQVVATAAIIAGMFRVFAQ
jgi:hypothetical protein